jgi:ferredoxin
LVIDPDVCISCGACEPVCPANAIFEEDEVPEQFRVSIKLNEELSKMFPEINERKNPLPEADKWKTVEDKLKYLIKDKAA